MVVVDYRPGPTYYYQCLLCWGRHGFTLWSGERFEGKCPHCLRNCTQMFVEKVWPKTKVKR